MTQGPTRVYRADIDGLRAIAILAVVLFHIERSWVPGGFAGVDIFFVISGYLITGHIVKDVGAGRFTFAEFYRRRIKRIIPALLFVVFVSYVAGSFLLLPADRHQLAASSLASIFFVANVYFTYALDFSYFSHASETAPLLHIWSLGVEEQFYLVWPALILLLTKLKRRAVMVAVAGLSVVALYALSQELAHSAPIFAYYMLPARACELGIGGLLALLPGRRPGAAASLAAGIAGIVLIGFSLAFINEGRSFPGFNAIPSTLGAALVMFAGRRQGNIVSRLLGLGPMVGLGLISYSLYLWHWPVVAYIRYVWGGMSPAMGLAALALMLVLAVFSYLAVEMPCRLARWSFLRVFAVQFALPATVLAGLSLVVIARDGGFVVTPAVSETRDTTPIVHMPPQPPYMSKHVCQRNMVVPADLRDPDCIINGKREPSILLWGDSNAAHYVGVIGAIAKKAHFSFRNIAHSACPPMLQHGADYANPTFKEMCAQSLKVVVPALKHYHTLIIAADWTTDVLLFPGFAAAELDSIKQLISQGKTIVILGRAPVMPNVDPKCAEKSKHLSWIECEKRSMYARADTYPINKTFKAFADSHDHVYYFNVDDVICPHHLCSAYLDHQLVYYDNGHFSMDGAWLVGHKVVEEGLVPDFFMRLGKATAANRN